MEPTVQMPSRPIIWVCSTDSPEFTQLSWTHRTRRRVEARPEPPIYLSISSSPPNSVPPFLQFRRERSTGLPSGPIASASSLNLRIIEEGGTLYGHYECILLSTTTQTVVPEKVTEAKLELGDHLPRCARRFTFKGIFIAGVSSHWSSTLNLGLKQVLEMPNCSRMVLRNHACDASNIVRAVIPDLIGSNPAVEVADCEKSSEISKIMDANLLHMVKKYGDKILLKDSDRKPKSKRKVKSSSGEMTHKERLIESVDDWLGPPPGDISLGGDGCPKFLCDVMVEGLAKH